MMGDKEYCMSHYLAFRFVADENKNFFPGLRHKVWKRPTGSALSIVDTPEEIESNIRREIDSFYVPGKTAIFLSGGIDSAILASYLPKGTKAYTFHCVAEGAINETEQAAKYAQAYGLDHEIIDMNWSDFEELTPVLLKHDGTPFHSIEVQLLKAVRHAQRNGYENLIVGDGADTLFGGLDGFLAKDRSLTEFKARFAYVNPECALKNPVDVTDIYRQFVGTDGIVEANRYIQDVFAIESTTSYMHVWDITGMRVLTPYCTMQLRHPLNIARIRGGEPKYLLRELFGRRFPNVSIPRKIPMPRATTQWFAEWSGPTRPEFIPCCQKSMTGDQKWLLWCLEQFLNAYEKGAL